MEDLMELVAASFARHGIECPVAEPKLMERRASSTFSARMVALGSSIEPTALPGHHYRKSLQGDPAP